MRRKRHEPVKTDWPRLVLQTERAFEVSVPCVRRRGEVNKRRGRGKRKNSEENENENENENDARRKKEQKKKKKKERKKTNLRL